MGHRPETCSSTQQCYFIYKEVLFALFFFNSKSDQREEAVFSLLFLKSDRKNVAFSTGEGA